MTSNMLKLNQNHPILNIWLMMLDRVTTRTC